MYKKGHIGINMMLFAPVLFLMMIMEFIILGLFGLVCVIYFASLPDKDLQYKFLKHRGFTHTYSFGIIIGIIMAGLYSLLSIFIMSIGLLEASLFNLIFIPFYGFFVGLFIVLGHVAGDVITPTGVRLFQKPKYVPNARIFSDKNYSFKVTNASSLPYNIAFLFFGLLSTSMAVFGGLSILMG